MPRRTKELQSVSPPMDLDEDDSADDELARELEEERQKILAQAKEAQEASTRSDGSHTTSDEDRGYIDEDTDEDVDTAAVDEDDSEDEWQPPEPASKTTRRSKRGRQPSSSEDSDVDEASALSEDETQPVSKKSKKLSSTKTSKTNGTEPRSKPKTFGTDPRRAGDPDLEDEEEYTSFDEEAERVQAEVEAAAAWAGVRRRKEAAQQSATNGSNSNTPSSQKQPPTSAPSLTAWLGKGPSASSSVSELASSLPMPTTCNSAQIIDRNSLFIGYVYPLTTTSSAYISTLLSHLTRVVHPTVPVDLLPPQFANAPANKRGSSHDMYAYRVLELKRGRSGLAGPDDFSLQEDKEDDGERWGGDRVLKVAREEGASDVLVVVSRWYGGELLGPVRFEHIEKAAREALVEHVGREEVEEFRQRIQWLDGRINRLKSELAGGQAGGGEREVAKYEGLTLDKGQRLWLARQKALDVLQKRVDQAKSNAAGEQGREASEELQAGPTEDATVEVATTPAPAQQEPDEPAPQSPTVKAEPSAPDLAASSPVNPASPSVKAEPADPQLTLKREDTIPDPQQPDDRSTVKFEPNADDLTGWDDLA